MTGSSKPKKGALKLVISDFKSRLGIPWTANFEGFISKSSEQWKKADPRGCLRFIGDEKIPTLYGDYTKPLEGSLLDKQYNGK